MDTYILLKQSSCAGHTSTPPHAAPYMIIPLHAHADQFKTMDYTKHNITEEKANPYTNKPPVQLQNTHNFVDVTIHRTATSRHVDLAERTKAFTRSCAGTDGACGSLVDVDEL